MLSFGGYHAGLVAQPPSAGTSFWARYLAVVAGLADDGQDVVLLDELAGSGRGLARVAAVVDAHVLDLRAVDAAVLVHVREVRPRPGLVAGEHAADAGDRGDVADLDRPAGRLRRRRGPRVGTGRRRRRVVRGRAGIVVAAGGQSDRAEQRHSRHHQCRRAT
jgi:hypothetical protein